VPVVTAVVTSVVKPPAQFANEQVGKNKTNAKHNGTNPPPVIRRKQVRAIRGSKVMGSAQESGWMHPASDVILEP
jgi:hypothetical protein